MLGIITKFHGPTNHRSSRISARASDGRNKMFIPWDAALSVEKNHIAAAKKFAEKWRWVGNYRMCDTHDGYVFIRSTDILFTAEGY